MRNPKSILVGTVALTLAASPAASGRPPRSMACYSCHAEHAAVDNTFVQFYLTLIETTKRKATYEDR
jgi:hypothetical protein